MREVLRIGAVAALDPEPERELSVWREDLERGAIDDPEETRRRLADYESGDWLLVALKLFADVDERGALQRYDGIEVRGCWMSRALAESDLEHARELVRDNLEGLQERLGAAGVEADIDRLESSRVEIELGEKVRERCRAAQSLESASSAATRSSRSAGGS